MLQINFLASHNSIAVESNISVSKTIPLRGSQGNYILIYADYINSISELDENNNIAIVIAAVLESENLLVYPVPFKEEINVLYTEDDMAKVNESSYKVELVDVTTQIGLC